MTSKWLKTLNYTKMNSAGAQESPLIIVQATWKHKPYAMDVRMRNNCFCFRHMESLCGLQEWWDVQCMESKEKQELRVGDCEVLPPPNWWEEL